MDTDWCPFLFVLNFALGVWVWTSPPSLSNQTHVLFMFRFFCPSVPKSCNPPPVSRIAKGVARILNGVARIADGVARITLALARSYEFLMIGGITKVGLGKCGQICLVCSCFVLFYVWFCVALFCVVFRVSSRG